MRKPGTDESNVQMSDVLCDFCGREWTEQVPMIEGHQGSCLCANCLTLAYTEVVVNGGGTAPDGGAGPAREVWNRYGMKPARREANATTGAGNHATGWLPAST